MPDRRTLTFDRLDQVMPEVDRLLKGHETIGNWSLGQICSHLAMPIRGSVEGFPEQAPWLIRKAVGPIAKREILRSGRMRAGIKLPDRVLPRPGLDARAEAEALRATIAYYLANPGPRVEHPILGRLTEAEWYRLHCIHAAHHLSFAIPSEVASPA